MIGIALVLSLLHFTLHSLVTRLSQFNGRKWKERQSHTVKKNHVLGKILVQYLINYSQSQDITMLHKNNRHMSKNKQITSKTLNTVLHAWINFRNCKMKTAFITNEMGLALGFNSHAPFFFKVSAWWEVRGKVMWISVSISIITWFMRLVPSQVCTLSMSLIISAEDRWLLCFKLLSYDLDSRSQLQLSYLCDIHPQGRSIWQDLFPWWMVGVLLPPTHSLYIQQDSTSIGRESTHFCLVWEMRNDLWKKKYPNYKSLKV